MMSRGFTEVGREDLEALRHALEQGRLMPPFARESLLATGFGHLEAELALLADLEADAARRVVELILAERRERVEPRLDLVWTGPEAKLAKARDTSVVVRELFRHAEREVLLCGYAFDSARELFEPLHEAMRERGVEATFFVNLERPEARGGRTVDVEAHVAAQIDRFLAESWPFGPPRPALYYDPRTVEPWSTASLHAKCAVIDRRKALVTSANFTSRGQERNLEVGVLIDDPAFARRLAEQWWGLVSAGLVRRAKVS